MLSSLPKLADRTFVLGAFLPTLSFAVAVLFLFRDNSLAKAWTEALSGRDLGPAVFLLLAVWLGAVAVLMLNHPLYRFLEGYSFPEPLSKRLISAKQKRLASDKENIQRLYEQWAQQGNAFGEIAQYRTLRRDAATWMPSERTDVLPTRFGNAIKAFEVYPRDIYGADAIVIWTRLMTVVPKEFAYQIEDVRSQIDFLVNCCLFSAIIAGLGVLRTIWSGHFYDIYLVATSGNFALVSGIIKSGLGWTFGGILAAYLFYRWAVARIPAWGQLVMTGFDCYLPALAGQLGFTLPATEPERRAFWTSLSQQLTYRREPNGEFPFRVEAWQRANPMPPNSKPEKSREPTPANGEQVAETGEEGG